MRARRILARCRTWLALGCAFCFVSLSAWGFQPLSDTIQVKTFPTHSRLIFRIDDDVPVEWHDTHDGFRAIFKGLGFTDLGAPLGEERAWAEQFEKSLHDPRLAWIRIGEVAGGLQIEGKWKFGKGPDAPADPQMETFDYREHSPGKYIVDYWIKKGPTIAEVEALKKKRALEAKAERLRAEVRHRANRRIASEKAKADANDLGKFCSEPLNDQKDVFLNLLPVEERINYGKYLIKRSPDTNFPYFVPQEDAPDARYVRLALKLYHDGKYALVVRTLDFMDAEQPHSQYHEEMRFLRANALLKLGLKAQGERILSDLKVQAKGKPAALFSALYFAAQMVRDSADQPPGAPAFKDPLAAYETFSWLFTYYPKHPLAWLFHMGAAESLAAIQQTDQAAKEFRWVVENAARKDQRAQAALRLGNLYLDRREYAQALEAYTTAIRYFRNQAENDPAIHLNRGESLYSLGKFDEARQVFEQYVRRFTAFPGGWRATFRLGEIYGRLPGAKNEKLSRHWFYETINRFPLSPGATLARLRLLPCGDHGGLGFEAARRFFDGEAKTFDATGQVSMVHYPEMRALAQARTYITLHHEDAAIDIVQKQMSIVKSDSIRVELENLYEGLLRKNILTLLDQGKDYQALRYYDARKAYLPQGVARPDPDYILKLSLAASRLGLGRLGEKLAANYADASKGRAIAAVDSSRKVPPDFDQKMRTSAKSFAEARSLWISGLASRDSENGIHMAERIRSKLEQVAAESPYSFEKEVILGLLEDHQGKPRTARDHALKAQVLIPASANGEKSGGAENLALQIEGWLAGLEVRAGDPKAALGMYRDLETRLEKRTREKKSDTPKDTVATFLGVPPAPTYEQVLLSEGDILEKQKRWGEMALVYSKAVEKKLGGNQAMYAYAHALLKVGGSSKREKAMETLQKLAGSKTDDFWKKLAKESLADMQLSERQE